MTGAGRGIGAAIATAASEAGAAVAVLDLDGGAAAATAAALPTKAIGVAADITDSAAVAAAVADAVDALGPIDVLVNNAGWDKIEPFLDNDESDWDKILTINLKGPIIVTRAVVDQMIERQSGAIVNIASDAGRVGSSGEAVYSAAKGGVIAFSKTMARELAALRHPGQLRLPRADRHRTARDDGRQAARRSRARHPHAPRRPAVGDRTGGRLPGQRRRRLRDRPDPLGQRRPHDGVTASTSGTRSVRDQCWLCVSCRVTDRASTGQINQV